MKVSEQGRQIVKSDQSSVQESSKKENFCFYPFESEMTDRKKVEKEQLIFLHYLVKFWFEYILNT